MPTAQDYDPRYLAGVLLFNAGDYFEAHEAWEDLWSEAHGNERKFYQGLIQAAVGLCHFCNGNLGGAVKLYHSSKDYMGPCGETMLGLNLTDFWQQMERCFRPLLAGNPDRSIQPDEELLPTIKLSPEPETWPAPEQYVHDDD